MYIYKYFHIYKGVYKFVCKCMLSFHYLPICLSYFSPSPLLLTPHPLDPNPFNANVANEKAMKKKRQYNDPMVFFIKTSCKDVGLKY